jgi:Zn-dependent protease
MSTTQDGSQDGSMPLFKVAGIQVSIHWTWLLLAVYEIEYRNASSSSAALNTGGLLPSYVSRAWNAAEFLSVFLIILLHEFGHSLACRQVGGEADRIVLSPLGGAAYVNPPPRAGAQLWSIAAGPLVNVALVPILFAFVMWADTPWYIPSDLENFAQAMFRINLGLLIFNMLPVYPLDGGQILRSILWFFVGPIRSLQASTSIGFVGSALLGIYGLWIGHIWLAVIAAFMFMNCRTGWLHARAWSEYERSRQ